MYAIGVFAILLGYALIYAGMSKFLKFPPANKPVGVLESLGIGVKVSGNKGGAKA